MGHAHVALLGKDKDLTGQDIADDLKLKLTAERCQDSHTKSEHSNQGLLKYIVITTEALHRTVSLLAGSSFIDLLKEHRKIERTSFPKQHLRMMQQELAYLFRRVSRRLLQLVHSHQPIEAHLANSGLCADGLDSCMQTRQVTKGTEFLSHCQTQLTHA